RPGRAAERAGLHHPGAGGRGRPPVRADLTPRSRPHRPRAAEAGPRGRVGLLWLCGWRGARHRGRRCRAAPAPATHQPRPEPGTAGAPAGCLLRHRQPLGGRAHPDVGPGAACPGRLRGPGHGQQPAVGREAELAELFVLLRRRPRLISVTGPGGVGKTRLALEAIRRFTDPGAAVLIPLEPVRHPLSLTSAVASCLRLRDQPGVEVIVSVEAALSATPRLVVIDGAEHLRDDVTALVSRLLIAVPELRIVVTSRTVLGVPGELCWPVPPMACPSSAAPVADIAASDAVRLFMARAEERLPGFATSDVAP